MLIQKDAQSLEPVEIDEQYRLKFPNLRVSEAHAQEYNERQRILQTAKVSQERDF